MNRFFDREVIKYLLTFRGIVCGVFYLSGGLAFLGITAYFSDKTQGFFRLCITAIALLICYRIRFYASKMALPKRSTMSHRRQWTCYILLGIALASMTEFLQGGLHLDYGVTTLVMFPFSAYGLATVTARIFL